MSESSVKDILAKFNQGNGPQMGPRPSVSPKPGKAAKPSHFAFKDDAPSSAAKPSNGINGFKPPGKPWAPSLNINDLAAVKLKKPPMPRTPDERKSSENQVTGFKLQPKPKPKPAAPARADPAPVSQQAPTHFPFKPSSPSSAHSPSPSIASPRPETPSKPATLGKKPKPSPVAPSRKDSLTKAERTPELPGKPSFLHPKPRISQDEDKENRLKNGFGAEEPAPPISDSENSSVSSGTDTPSRRTSFLHTKKPVPVLQPLPPLAAIGNAPRKPPKPHNVSLARFTPTTETPPPRLPKPGLDSPPPPTLPARPSIPIGSSAPKPRPSPPAPVPTDDAEDAGEIYDDVESNLSPPPPPSARRSNRPISLIQTMDSDEEEVDEGGFDDIYDDAESTQAPAAPVPPPHSAARLPHPTLKVTTVDPPPLPSISSIPAYHGSGGSSISFPRSAEHSGSGLDEPGEIYDDVLNEAEGDHDELYEALDVDDYGNQLSNSTEVDSAREREQEKMEEKRRKEEEKLQKKEEEKRKKKERDDKKKKEKEEKDLRKKFNLKGDISILDEGIVMEAMDAVYEKLDLKCERGEKIEILRKEGNPPGKWLARNPGGHYGYVDHQFVRLEGEVGDEDCGEVYDDVIGGEVEEDNIYDAVN